MSVQHSVMPGCLAVSPACHQFASAHQSYLIGIMRGIWKTLTRLTSVLPITSNQYSPFSTEANSEAHNVSSRSPNRYLQHPPKTYTRCGRPTLDGQHTPASYLFGETLYASDGTCKARIASTEIGSIEMSDQFCLNIFIPNPYQKLIPDLEKAALAIFSAAALCAAVAPFKKCPLWGSVNPPR